MEGAEISRLPTAFAPAERASHEELEREVQLVAAHPLLEAVLDAFDGLIMVLNDQRQVVAVSDRVLGRLGFKEGFQPALGLRTGEILHCIHAAEHPGGCGSCAACIGCGATVSVLESRRLDRQVREPCLLSFERGGNRDAIEFEAQATPLDVAGRRFTLLTLRDVSDSHRREQLERVFLHDIAGTVTALEGWSDLLEDAPGAEQSRIKHQVCRLASVLRREVSHQRALRRAEHGDLALDLSEVSVFDLLAELQALFAESPLARDRTLAAPESGFDVKLTTDRSLLMRVLANMVQNAFEATPPGGEVRFTWRGDGERVAFDVWNAGEIPPGIVPRVFHRSFSTKSQAGRGLGTYSMKLFGERYLGGRVSFTSGGNGTVFRIDLPLGGPAAHEE
ncbi:MAG TPA: sensor histidine kinase [Polyangia bacterium]|nr:sensor histidine kinase [Polyangia bacterium]